MLFSRRIAVRLWPTQKRRSPLTASNRRERVKRPFPLGTPPAFIFFQRLLAQGFDNRSLKNCPFGRIERQTIYLPEGRLRPTKYFQSILITAHFAGPRQSILNEVHSIGNTRHPNAADDAARTAGTFVAEEGRALIKGDREQPANDQRNSHVGCFKNPLVG